MHAEVAGCQSTAEWMMRHDEKAAAAEGVRHLTVCAHGILALFLQPMKSDARQLLEGKREHGDAVGRRRCSGVQRRDGSG